MANKLTSVDLAISDFLCNQCRTSTVSERHEDDFQRLIHEEELKEGAKIKLFVSESTSQQTGPGRFEASFAIELPSNCPSCRIGLVDATGIAKKMLKRLLDEIARHPQPLNDFRINLTDPQNAGGAIKVTGSIICPQCAR
jgi:hypothetical protein